jgi:hypothetical protein
MLDLVWVRFLFQLYIIGLNSLLNRIVYIYCIKSLTCNMFHVLGLTLIQVLIVASEGASTEFKMDTSNPIKL